MAKFEVSLPVAFCIALASVFGGVWLGASATRDSISREALRAKVVYRDLETGALHFYNPCADTAIQKQTTG